MGNSVKQSPMNLLAPMH